MTHAHDGDGSLHGPKREPSAKVDNNSRPTTLFALLLLTLVTGIVDAASVLGLSHVFTANMTGNVVFLGFALAGKGTASIAASLQALGGFLLGAALGGRVTKTLSSATLRLGLSVELAGLGLAALLSLTLGDEATFVIVSLLAFAMGLRNAIVRKLGVPDLTTTVLTLTLTGLAADSQLASKSNPRWGRRALAVLFMLGGALLGGLTLTLGMPVVLSVAVAIEAIAIALLALRWTAPLDGPLGNSTGS